MQKVNWKRKISNAPRVIDSLFELESLDSTLYMSWSLSKFQSVQVIGGVNSTRNPHAVRDSELGIGHPTKRVREAGGILGIF